MRIDLRSDEDKYLEFKVFLNGLEVDNVVAVDTDERWIVRKLTPEEIRIAEYKGMSFIPGADPTEIVYISIHSTLKIEVLTGAVDVLKELRDYVGFCKANVFPHLP